MECNGDPFGLESHLSSTISFASAKKLMTLPAAPDEFLYDPDVHAAFGYGDIEVRSASGDLIVDRTEGVIFAAWHAEQMKCRVAVTDVSFGAETEIKEEEVEALVKRTRDFTDQPCRSKTLLK